MTKIHSLAAILLCTAMIAASPATNDQQPARRMGPMNNAFAIDLYSRLSADGGNVFFSPTSVQTALEMTSAGAGGKTADEMASTLHLDPSIGDDERFGTFLKNLNAEGKIGGYQLSIANALWGAKGYPFKLDYLTRVEKEFAGHLSDMDFAGNPDGSRKTINEWVAKETHDKIRDLLPSGSIQNLTRLVLTNAIYFKAKWDFPFKKELTREEDFTLADGKKVKASMMHQQKNFNYAEDDAVAALELPYGNGDLAMWIFLPKAADGLPAFEKGLTTERMAGLTSRLRSESVNVSLPKFRIESGYGLRDALENMGMKLAFDQRLADFSGMTSAEHMALSAVIHKAYVYVDEEGTEAAAATATLMLGSAVRKPVPPKVFRADHPFVFAIVRQKSGAMLFMGRLAKP